jgi:CotH kinase protein
MRYLLSVLICCVFGAHIVRAQVLVSSNLPIVLIETTGLSIPDEPKITAQMRIAYNGVGQRNLVAGPFLGYDGTVGIEVRGSTSQQVYDKKGYGIELRNPDGTDREEELLGMPKESDWILVGPYNDKSLMRDALAYWTAGQVMSYAPRAHHVEVMINGSYEGVYILVEKIKRDKKRVNVAKSSASDVTGGYIIKLDKFTGATNDSWPSTFRPTGAGAQITEFLYHYPEPDAITTPQKMYIQRWFKEFETALSGPQYRDTLVGYRKYINTASFIDYALVNEAFRNVDAYRLSTFCYKNRDSIDGRLYMGPVWDFNIGMGLGDYCQGQETAGWAWDMDIFCPQDQWLVPFWWQRLRTDKRFTTEMSNRWRDLRQSGAMNTQRQHFVVDSMAALLQEAQLRNFQKWPVLGKYIWPNAFVGNSYASEVSYLKGWLTNRLKWMDVAIPNLSVSIPPDTIEELPASLYPNPNPSGQFWVSVIAKANDKISVRIYTIDGRVVQSTAAKATSEGPQNIKWPAILNESGLFFYEIKVNDVRKGSGELLVRL